jgi:hypothetical protein
MTTLCNSSPLGSRQAFQRTLQAWVFERLFTLNLASGDLRIAVIALLAGALAAAGNAWFEAIATRALQGAQFARRVMAADTMVATGGR